ncbi:MAG: hypothetical protein Q7R98_00125 [Candidatus Jorgensenbacteria bacterium]|nr:hypothetical protein [Candidatus Jorgensenbacteria bacterium]
MKNLIIVVLFGLMISSCASSKMSTDYSRVNLENISGVEYWVVSGHGEGNTISEARDFARTNAIKKLLEFLDSSTISDRTLSSFLVREYKEKRIEGGFITTIKATLPKSTNPKR